MPRNASSILEWEQISRVHGLLKSIDLCPPPLLEVVLVNGQSFVGTPSNNDRQ